MPDDRDDEQERLEEARREAEERARREREEEKELEHGFPGDPGEGPGENETYGQARTDGE